MDILIATIVVGKKGQKRKPHLTLTPLSSPLTAQLTKEEDFSEEVCTTNMSGLITGAVGMGLGAITTIVVADTVVKTLDSTVKKSVPRKEPEKKSPKRVEPQRRSAPDHWMWNTHSTRGRRR